MNNIDVLIDGPDDDDDAIHSAIARGKRMEAALEANGIPWEDLMAIRKKLQEVSSWGLRIGIQLSHAAFSSRADIGNREKFLELKATIDRVWQAIQPPAESIDK